MEYDVVKLKRFEKSVTSIIEAMNFRFEDLEIKCLFKRISFWNFYIDCVTTFGDKIIVNLKNEFRTSEKKFVN